MKTVLIVAATLTAVLVAASVGIAVFIVHRAIEPAEWMPA